MNPESLLATVLLLAAAATLASRARRVARGELPGGRAWWLLVELPGEIQPREHMIASLPIVIGRDPGADVRIERARISRQHVRLEARSGRFYLRDLYSANGTEVEGMEIRGGAVEVSPGQEILLAGEVRLSLLSSDLGPDRQTLNPWLTHRWS